QIVPLGVVLPKTEDDVRAAVRICARFGAPITARGGSTSQGGQAIGPGVIMDFSQHMGRILEIPTGQRWPRLHPGWLVDENHHEVGAAGLQFAPDISTSSRATIGGMIANNSSGTHSLIHGKTIDHVLELQVLLADGTVVHARPLEPGGWDKKALQGDRE